MPSTKINKDAQELRKRIWKNWGKIDKKLLEKFKNINGKTGSYDVPDVLFQKRTSRSNRVLLRWKVIKDNSITYNQLETFYGGVCVEFVNDDYFDNENKKNDLFKDLIYKIGSDNKISAILSFRNESGDAGANEARIYYNKYKNGNVDYSSPIKRKGKFKGKGDNSVWDGNLFYSVKGGSQKSYESHKGKGPRLFNPAVEYANEMVCLDIDITMSYFALHCYDINKQAIENYKELKEEIEKYLSSRWYLGVNLLDYCKNHHSLKWGNGILIDPIQLSQMSIHDFKTSGQENSSVVAHNEAANKYKFYFDTNHNFILSPARPNNLFWAKHLSNMMQQNCNLDEYFMEEEKRFNKRKKLIKELKQK